LAVALAWLAVVLHLSPRFGTEYSPDSYGLALLGENVFAGRGYTSPAIRDFYLPPADEAFVASRSFPPLWPIAAGLANRLSGLGIGAGLALNLIILAGLFQVHYALVRRLGGRAWPLLFLWLPLFVVTNAGADSFAAEVVSARTIPLAALLALSAMLLACTVPRGLRRDLGIGAVLGLLYLTRFDAAFFCVGMLVALATRDVRGAARSALAFTLALAPWALRNLVVFGNPFASDNAITALSTYPSIVQICWFDQLPLWSDDPGLWMRQRFEYLGRNALVLTRSITPAGALVALALSFWGLRSRVVASRVKLFIALALLWIATNLLAVSLTPYSNARYFSISTLLVVLSGLLVVTSELRRWSMEPGRAAPRPGVPHALSWVAALAIAVAATGSRIAAGDRDAPKYRKAAESFASNVPPGTRVGSRNAEQLAYYSRWRTIYLPYNLHSPDATLADWAARFDVRLGVVAEGTPLANERLVKVLHRAHGFALVELDQSTRAKTRAGTP
jgi:hypothetical protein